MKCLIVLQDVLLANLTLLRSTMRFDTDIYDIDKLMRASAKAAGGYSIGSIPGETKSEKTE
jgi:hypothetical protein